MYRSLSIALAVTLVAGCARSPIEPIPASESNCARNLKAIAVLLRVATPQEPDYPRTLDALGSAVHDGSVFVCPCTGHKPGETTQIEEWSDYVYMGGLPDLVADPRVAWLICPPENHGGDHGYVVWLSGEVERLPAHEIRRLITIPWSLASNAPLSQLTELQKKVDIRVSRRFREMYRLKPQVEGVEP